MPEEDGPEDDRRHVHAVVAATVRIVPGAVNGVEDQEEDRQPEDQVDEPPAVPAADGLRLLGLDLRRREVSGEIAVKGAVEALYPVAVVSG